MPEIICVKIAQRALPGAGGYQYFPYDRVYLMPQELRPTAIRMFRYFFELELDAGLLAALNHLSIAHERKITVERNDVQLQGKDSGKIPNIGHPEAWRLIVPTHIKGRRREEKSEAAAEEAVLMYQFSKVLRRSATSNSAASLPRISLHTPYRDIPLFCAVCTKILDFHDNKCTPGKGTCAKNAEAILPADTYFHEVLHAPKDKQ
jgi:hypothetical protein